MSFDGFYITADAIGTPTGGGCVTFNELEALKSICHVEVINPRPAAPFDQDKEALEMAKNLTAKGFKQPLELAHVYAGCFSETVKWLKAQGVKVTYTAAAHDVAKSKEEHERLGLPFDYPHLTDPELWKQYLAGYKEADVLVCPSWHSRTVMRGFGCEQHIEIIPHGCHLPEAVKPVPKRFTVGYLGAYGPDKGIRVLLEAWKKLDWSDATLILAGRDSCSEWPLRLIGKYGGGNITVAGWQRRVSDFYNSISCYVQSSLSEGFGIEVLEAMAHGRPVICSDGAGAVDIVESPFRFRAGDSGHLMERLKWIKDFVWDDVVMGVAKSRAAEFTWDKIRERYVKLWGGLVK